VGAVARDARGGLAAATSTGGTSGKHPGRVGDSPLIGAGTWADDATVAVSCTGDGEAVIRGALAHEVDALVRFAGLPLAEACERALASIAGQAGLIAVGADALAMPFTTPAMPCTWRTGSHG
jgi:beta-aspartyl-peptidase (threonine type)